MPKTYTRLTEEERYQIYEWVTDKQSRRQIAAIFINTFVIASHTKNEPVHPMPEVK